MICLRRALIVLAVLAGLALLPGPWSAPLGTLPAAAQAHAGAMSDCDAGRLAEPVCAPVCHAGTPCAIAHAFAASAPSDLTRPVQLFTASHAASAARAPDTAPPKLLLS